MDLGALLVSSFLAATILPFASEIPLAVVVRRHGHVLLSVAVAVATPGNLPGACTTYGLARLSFVPFSIWTLIGKAAWYGAVAWIALNV